MDLSPPFAFGIRKSCEERNIFNSSQMKVRLDLLEEDNLLRVVPEKGWGMGGGNKSLLHST